MTMLKNPPDFDKSVAMILKWEGGYVNHPDDQGGPTNLGITLATLSAWRKHPVNEADIAALTVTEAKAIYKARYWDALKLDQVQDARVAFLLFDRAVNSGGGGATHIAQQTCLEFDAVVGLDGVMGPSTLAAINGCLPGEFCTMYLQRSQIFLAQLCQARPSQIIFLKGWLARTHKAQNALPAFISF